MPIKRTPAKELPQEFRRYFWDTSFDELSFKKSPRFIAERILNFGNQKDIKWLLSQTDRAFLKSIITTSRNLNAKTRNYWKIVLG